MVFIWVSFQTIKRRYHVIKEVNSPVEGLTDAGDVLEPLGTAVVLVDFINGKAGHCDGITRQHTDRHEELEHSLDAVEKQGDHSESTENAAIVINFQSCP